MNIQGISSLITAPLLGRTASSPSSTSSTGSTSNTSSSSTNGTSASDLQMMFLNLLVTELQNQVLHSRLIPLKWLVR